MKRQPRHRATGINTLMTAVLRALSICAPAVLLDAPAAFAQAVEPTELTAGIPAQPLAPALQAFARQTGLQLIYVSYIVRDQRSRPVPAGLDASDALARMLEGTGLKFEYLTPRSIRILAAVAGPPRASTPNIPEGDALQEVIVTANAHQGTPRRSDNYRYNHHHQYQLRPSPGPAHRGCSDPGQLRAQ